MPIEEGWETGRQYLCCDKVVKLRTTTKFEGGYCPFCGELVDGD